MPSNSPTGFKRKGKVMARFELIYHNKDTNNERGCNYDNLTLTKALEFARHFRMHDEYVYLTNLDTNETFVTYNGFELSVVAEV